MPKKRKKARPRTGVKNPLKIKHYCEWRNEMVNFEAKIGICLVLYLWVRFQFLCIISFSS